MKLTKFSTTQHPLIEQDNAPAHRDPHSMTISKQCHTIVARSVDVRDVNARMHAPGSRLLALRRGRRRQALAPFLRHPSFAGIAAVGTHIEPTDE